MRPVQEEKRGTERAFGRRLPPALALETISERRGAEGKQGRKDIPPRLGDSLASGFASP